ncbi:MAG: acetate--CoA ligase family protein [Rhodospirillaceae bacterium]
MSASTEAPGARLREAFFSPRTIALVGASADTTKNNSRPQRFLKKHGYTGRILPINPGRSEILGETAYPDLRSAPGPIDHVFIMVPAPAVPGIIEQCCELKIPVATMFSAGFAELGEEGAKRQRDMVERARAGGLRLLGPNCMGVINVHDKTPLTVNAVIEHEALKPGPLSVISQSGSMLGTMITRAQPRGLGFSKLVSVGNECDLGVGELAEMLVDDPDTGAILLFLETFRDSANLARAARRAYEAGKPVIAYKLGRSGVGRAVATSHTGAMTGPDEIANAFFRQHGIIRVDMIESLFETPRLVMGQKPPKQKRVAVVTGTGGAAAMVVDRLGVLGAEVVPPSDEVIANLAAKDIHIAQVPLTDIPMGRSEGGRYTNILSELLASDHCDAVVSVIGSSSRNPQVLVDRVLSAQHRDRKPLAVFLAPKADDGLVMLEQNGVASFRTPETCADAVNSYLNWRAPAEAPVIGADEVAAARELLSQSKRSRLNERDSCRLFSSLGIEAVDTRVLQAPADCSSMTGPLAVKILSADIPHKTDAGLVKLNVAPADARGEVGRMLDAARSAFPKAKIDGVLVQRMERGVAEVIVGFRRDPEVGPVVLLGAGGIAAELRRSYCVRIAPVTLEQARAMIEEVRELALIRGFRNLPRGDVDGLARAISSMSRIAALQDVTEAEINPLLVREEGKGVVAVDGLVVFRA